MPNLANPPAHDPPQTPAQTSALHHALQAQLAQAGGWLAFDDFMHAALYTPGLGYYAHGSQKLGSLPPRRAADGTPIAGSDFVTSPELSPLFGACVGQQVAQALLATGTHCVLEIGAGSGALALQICELLIQQNLGPERYFILEVSSSLRARQQALLAHLGSRVQWLDSLPAQFEGIVVGNEVLDAMPVKLLQRSAGVWHERGVVASTDDRAQGWAWQDRPTSLRPSVDIAGPHDYLTEIHPQAEALSAPWPATLRAVQLSLLTMAFPTVSTTTPSAIWAR